MSTLIRQPKPVPYLIQEKIGVFDMSVTCVECIISLLSSKRPKGVHTYERLLRKVLREYPLGMSAISSHDGVNDLIKADALVMRAWYLVQPNRKNRAEEWGEALRLLLDAWELIGFVYAEEQGRYQTIRRAGEGRPNASEARKKEALASLEPFRLKNLYKRYTKTNSQP